MVDFLENDIKSLIYTIRGQQVMLDSDLARLYGYETKNFNRQVKNNIEKFEGDDFMFRLSNVETNELSRCKNFTLNNDGGRGKNIKYHPYAFTEQGIYMLMTVLKGELAVKQSRILVKTFKEMRHYILENKILIGHDDIIRLSIQTNQNTLDIQKIDSKFETVASKNDLLAIKDDITAIMDNFIDETKIKEFVFVDGQKFEADEAYINIYKLAKKSIYVVDDYVSIKTLSHLKQANNGVKVILITDNKAGRSKLTLTEVNDFISESFLIELRETAGLVHDRLIVLDYGTGDEKIYLCGASSKDAGAKFCTILEVHDVSNYHGVIDKLLLNNLLVL